MPISLPPVSRRRFLRGSFAAAAGVLVAPHWSWGARGSDVELNHLALLSDIHLDADRKLTHKDGVNMWDNFRRASDEILALGSRLGMALVNGDCAHLMGHPKDYETVVDALKPLREAGLPLHLAVGNHDNREHLKAAINQDRAEVSGVGDRRVMRLDLPAADWYMLDSLQITDKTPGELGAQQLSWLKQSLDARPNRAAVVMVHHQPHEHKPEEHTGGLIDTKEFLDAVEPRKQVKAILFGHTHVWRHYKKDGLHFVNLPTTAYVFDPKEPSAWVDAHLTDGAMTLQLHSLTPNHPWDKQTLDLKWR